MRFNRVGGSLLTLVSVLALLTAGRVAAQPVQANDLKAAFVFNFVVFTEWPRQVLPDGAPINICAGAGNAMLPALLQLHEKQVNGHRIAVRSSVTPVRGCHVLVLERADREQWPQYKRELGGSHVLTVSDELGADGAVIVLSMQNQRVGFDIDLSAARSTQLTISSKLLRLARNVQ